MCRARAPHIHASDEIIGFFGSDPAQPYDLGGEVKVWCCLDSPVSHSRD